jgi:RNA polymerase sigma-70 factor (ECF subfamily)
MESGEQARSIAEAAARRSYGKLVAFLAARTRDVAAAEDALSEAFAAALANWPDSGCPANPEAWLLTVARRKLIDAYRSDHADQFAAGELERLLAAAPVTDEIPDERLAMMFACANPAIDAAVRAPLVLQVVLGLDAKAIASAFLTSPDAMSKRLVRAKSKIRDAQIPFCVPARAELADRLDAVLDAIYAAYSEGWTDPTATDAARRELAEEAIFLARLVAELMPREPEALGLLSLLLHTEARRRARRAIRKERTQQQEFVPLAEQDPAQWNVDLIDEAESLLHQASALGSLGRFQLQAALQSAHVYRRRTGRDNWTDIVELYDALLALTGSPVVAINRAVALAELRGAAAGLEALDQVAADARLAEYQPWWAARAELLARIGAHVEARKAYSVAIGLERDDAVRRFLARRQGALPN